MPLQYRQLPGYPILIFEVEGHYTVENTRDIYRIAGDFKKENKLVYRLIDLSNSESTYVEMFDILRFAADLSAVGSYVDPNALSILITNHEWSHIMPIVMQVKPLRGRSLPMFDLQSEAIQYAKLHYSFYHSPDGQTPSLAELYNVRS